MRRTVGLIGGLVLVLVLVSFASVQKRQPAPPQPRTAIPAAVTFTRDIAPIMYEHCASCHRPGEIAPMSLVTYHEVRRYALNIQFAAVNREMPPYHVFVPDDATHAARLDEYDLRVITRWVDQGAPEGNPRDLPPLPNYLRKKPKPTA